MKKSVGPILGNEEHQHPHPLADEADLPRRSFVQLLGASLAAAGAAGCTRTPNEKILPYSADPKVIVPGRPLRYATASVFRGLATGLLVQSWQGHPTKVDGNPLDPWSGGATSAFDQAQPQLLYHPQRARQVSRRAEPATWRSFRRDQIERGVRLRNGERVRFLVDPDASPFLAAVRARVRAAFPGVKFYAHDPADGGAREGARIAFGAALDARHDVSQATVIVALDADFLGEGAGHLRHLRDFAQRRDPGRDMNRLYVAESGVTTTGMAADHRLRVRAREIREIALGIASRLATGSPALAPIGGAPRAAETPERARFLDAVAKDLRRTAGRSLVITGERQPPEVHAVVHAINEALGNAGVTVSYAERPDEADVDAGPGALARLAGEISAGAVDTLVITAWNPVYSAPGDLGLGPLIASLPNSVYLGLFEDETWRECTWRIPATHFLESWGDARRPDGGIALVQPLIAPLFGGLQVCDVLASMLPDPDATPHEKLRAFWRSRSREIDFESAWVRWLSEGSVPGTEIPARRAPVRWDAVTSAVRSTHLEPGGELDLELAIDPKVYDGRFRHSSWLQELPHPVSKMTWDNAAFVSPATARRLGVADGDVVRLTVGGRFVHAPVFVVAGQADGSVILPLGYGGKIGVDAYTLRSASSPWFQSGLAAEKTGRRHTFAITQDHQNLEGRPLVVHTTLEELTAHPEHVTEGLRGDVATMHEFPGGGRYQWAMAIDLNRCVGCGSCVIACQSENNVPTVGRDQVARGREMHWLRIDRYVEGDPEDPLFVNEPMACVHCETAPCEYVCPVNATVHDDEGLNEMVYNRCIGTRYCSNNCPYKVRRFNYFRWTGQYSETERMTFNPDVTVRGRGVMEKCTYCVQRIERARIESRIEGREIREGEVTTACAEACAARAIVFGSLHDPASKVAQRHRDVRRFDVLHELGTKPRTAYLAKVRNLNPELA